MTSVIHEIGDFGYAQHLSSEQQALYEQKSMKEDKELEERINQREKEVLNSL